MEYRPALCFNKRVAELKGKTVFGVTGVIDSISPAVDTSNHAVAELPQKAKVNEGQFAALVSEVG